MKTKFSAFLISLLISSSARAAFELKPAGARAAGFSGAYAALSLGADAPFWNPAGLALLRSFEASSFYARLYSLKELSFAGGSAAVRTPLGGFAAAYSQFGPDAYRENEYILSHGFRLSRQFFVGTSLRGEMLTIQGFGSDFAYSVDAGCWVPFSGVASAGVVAKNLNRATIGESKVKLPQGFLAGIAFHPFKGVTLGAGLERLDPGPLSIKSGIEYEWGPLSIRGGAQNNAARFSGGLGIHVRGFQIDYAYLQHTSLGGTHSMSLSWRGREKYDP